MAVFVSYLYYRPGDSQLPQAADHPVLDSTGLPGFFDFTLDWAPSDTVQPEAGSTGPSLFAALVEQTGLKLEPRKSPLNSS